MGVPRFYETVEELDLAIQSYFDENGEDLTIPGLAYHLGFESRQSIYDYKEREIFSYSIKRAILKIESVYAKKLAGQNVTGIIFALKNMGWKDKTETEHSGAMGIVWQEEKTYNETKPKTDLSD
jgi:hypothetical protein